MYVQQTQREGAKLESTYRFYTLGLKDDLNVCVGHHLIEPSWQRLERVSPIIVPPSSDRRA